MKLKDYATIPLIVVLLGIFVIVYFVGMKITYKCVSSDIIDIYQTDSTYNPDSSMYVITFYCPEYDKYKQYEVKKISIIDIDLAMQKDPFISNSTKMVYLK